MRTGNSRFQVVLRRLHGIITSPPNPSELEIAESGLYCGVAQWLQIVETQHVSKIFAPLRGEGECWWIFFLMEWKRGSTRLVMYNLQSQALFYFFSKHFIGRLVHTQSLGPPGAKNYNSSRGPNLHQKILSDPRNPKIQ